MNSRTAGTVKGQYMLLCGTDPYVGVIDLRKMEVYYTLLLDEPQHGAANPWGVAWSAGGKTLAVAHAGTHEISIINFPMLLATILDV
jgi:hypothetical protein